MAAKKQGTTKMSLGEFMGGSNWADEVDEGEFPAPGGDAGRDQERAPERDDRGGDRGGYGGDRGGYGGDRGGDRGGYGGDRGGYGGDRGGYGGDRGGDRGYGGGGGGYDRPERKAVPVPDEPPFVAYIGNLAYDVMEDELGEFFSANCQVDNVRVVKGPDGRSKGFGYVEFKDKQSIEMALEANEFLYAGRAMRVDVAEQRNSRSGFGGQREGGFGGGRDAGYGPPSEADTADNWRRGEVLTPPERDNRGRGGFGGDRGGDRGGFGGDRGGDRGGFGGDRGGDRGGFGGDRGFGGGRGGRREDGDRPYSRGSGGERPRLNLKPRSADAASAASGAYGKAKSNPFGDAKPRDEAAYEKRKAGDKKADNKGAEEAK